MNKLVFESLEDFLKYQEDVNEGKFGRAIGAAALGAALAFGTPQMGHAKDIENPKIENSQAQSSKEQGENSLIKIIPIEDARITLTYYKDSNDESISIKSQNKGRDNDPSDIEIKIENVIKFREDILEKYKKYQEWVEIADSTDIRELEKKIPGDDIIVDRAIIRDVGITEFIENVHIEAYIRITNNIKTFELRSYLKDDWASDMWAVLFLDMSKITGSPSVQFSSFINMLDPEKIRSVVNSTTRDDLFK